MITLTFLKMIYSFVWEIVDWILHPISKAKSSLFGKVLGGFFKFIVIASIYMVAFIIIVAIILIPLLIDLISLIINYIKNKRTNN